MDMSRLSGLALLLLWPWTVTAQTVFAAASLAPVLEALAAHEKSVYLSFAGSSTLAKQIEAGAPADIYFSANSDWMDYLQTRGLIESDTRIDLLGNALVLIAYEGESFPVRVDKNFDFAAAFTGRLALGDPAHVPAGLYAREALENLGWWPGLKKRIAPAPDVRAALVYVERGECTAGLIYATDIAHSDRIDTLATVPDSLHQPIVYPIAAVKGRADKKTRELLAFLQSDLAIDLYRKYGFTVLKTYAAQP